MFLLIFVLKVPDHLPVVAGVLGEVGVGGATVGWKSLPFPSPPRVQALLCLGECVIPRDLVSRSGNDHEEGFDHGQSPDGPFITLVNPPPDI